MTIEYAHGYIKPPQQPIINIINNNNSTIEPGIYTFHYSAENLAGFTELSEPTIISLGDKQSLRITLPNSCRKSFTRFIFYHLILFRDSNSQPEKLCSWCSFDDQYNLLPISEIQIDKKEQIKLPSDKKYNNFHEINYPLLPFELVYIIGDINIQEGFYEFIPQDYFNLSSIEDNLGRKWRYRSSPYFYVDNAFDIGGCAYSLKAIENTSIQLEYRPNYYQPVKQTIPSSIIYRIREPIEGEISLEFTPYINSKSLPDTMFHKFIIVFRGIIRGEDIIKNHPLCDTDVLYEKDFYFSFKDLYKNDLLLFDIYLYFTQDFAKIFDNQTNKFFINVNIITDFSYYDDIWNLVGDVIFQYADNMYLLPNKYLEVFVSTGRGCIKNFIVKTTVNKSIGIFEPNSFYVIILNNRGVFSFKKLNYSPHETNLELGNYPVELEPDQAIRAFVATQELFTKPIFIGTFNCNNEKLKIIINFSNIFQNNKFKIREDYPFIKDKLIPYINANQLYFYYKLNNNYYKLKNGILLDNINFSQNLTIELDNNSLFWEQITSLPSEIVDGGFFNTPNCSISKLSQGSFNGKIDLWINYYYNGYTVSRISHSHKIGCVPELQVRFVQEQLKMIEEFLSENQASNLAFLYALIF